MKHLFPVASLAAIAIVACSKTPAESTVLQPDDLAAADVPFNASEIVDLASFTDAVSIPSAQVLAFVEMTPYNRPSFLSTYTSNGVSAVDAIMNAATNYSLNPLVFLVRAEMDEGLVGEEVYPIGSPSSVEYVFGCGCANGQSACDPALAGFDVQVDCLGRTLRASLASVAAEGHTSGGWGPSIQTRTLDNVDVTPVDASTAALYQYTPAVYVGQQGGNWLFWNLWQKYAAALAYEGGTSTQPTSWIGDTCATSGTCDYAGGECVTNYPQGLCTAACTTANPCPTNPTEVAAFCADFQAQGGFCLPVCNPAASACRPGYTCQQVAEFGNATQSAYACVPQSN